MSKSKPDQFRAGEASELTGNSVAGQTLPPAGCLSVRWPRQECCARVSVETKCLCVCVCVGGGGGGGGGWGGGGGGAAGCFLTIQSGFESLFREADEAIASVIRRCVTPGFQEEDCVSIVVHAVLSCGYCHRLWWLPDLLQAVLAARG